VIALDPGVTMCRRSAQDRKSSYRGRF
jgi:hypothetical protein